ncbi:putative NBD/HSP70 family sugar kinase [Lipingzhangella halophila]|uniref:Putative NBD/HSP70 family sugar kinase n=1 Tax=Lipingzhangella halophila TaxID=1783352 RepID=A0A7W7RGF1_9ACTN|nr:ROK family transcriptional regulator [Lipingzhangella halophila]MBB4931178.1 putative NBD/HSP70 family sugar kinase [Lipingzhangella halophila]
MATGTNLLWLGGLNQSRVLEVIRRSDNVSRVELAEQTGLTPQTVSNIVRRLLRDELVLEVGRASSRGGKPATMLRLNATAYYAVGMHLDPATTTLVVTDLSGRVITRMRRRTPSTQGPRRVLDTLVRAVRTIVEQSEVPPSRILGIGVATPGPIDASGGVVITPPNLPGWHAVPVRESLEEETGFEVVIDNDATAATIGERWAGGEKRSADMAFIYIGTGIGGGLVLDGQVYRGSSWNAAEIGHVTVDPQGPDCPCGNRGCLETYLAPHAVAADAARRRGEKVAGLERGRAGAVTAYRRVCREARAGDPVAVQTIKEAGRRLGQAGITLLNIADVPMIVLGGWGISHVGTLYSEALNTAVAERTIARSMRKTQVDVSLTGEDVGAIGAASLVLHTAYSPRVNSL